MKIKFKLADAKVLCAERHFKAISSDVVKYDVVRNYEDLLKIVAD